MGWQDHEPTVGGTGDGSRSWRQPTSGGPAPEPHRSFVVTKARSKQFFAASLAGVSAVVLITLLMLFSKGCTSTDLFVVTTFNYEGDKVGAIPPNWMGESDLAAFESFKSNKRVKNPGLKQYKSEVEFQNDLKNLEKGKSTSQKKDTVCVISLSAHAVLDSFFNDWPSDTVKLSESEVVFVSNDDDFVSKDKKLKLSDLWNALRKPNLPDEQKKLVLLDISRLQGQWRLGVFDNFVIEGIQESVKRAKIPNLYVMTSCSSGETSWVSPHLGESGQSVFAHFVALGLDGDADKKPFGDGNNRVTVSELFRFVNSRVYEWVKQNRDPDGQHPRLFSSDGDDLTNSTSNNQSDFPVASINTRKRDQPKDAIKAKDAPGAVTDEVTDTLFRLWTRRKALEQTALPANAIYHLAPVGFRALTQRLMRAEEFLVHHHAALAAIEIEKAEKLCVDLEALSKQGHFEAASFGPDEVFLRRLAERFGLGATQQTDRAAPPTGNTSTDKVPLPLPHDHLKTVLSEAHKKHEMPVILKGADSASIQKELVELRQLAEDVAFGHHTVLQWLRQDLNEADRLRRLAEDSFFVVDTNEARLARGKAKKETVLSDAEQSVSKAKEVQSQIYTATKRFRELRDKAHKLEEAQFLLNRCCATLPEWLSFVSGRSTNSAIRKTRLEVMNQYHDPIGKNRQPTADILSYVWLNSKDNRPSSLDQLDKEILSVALEAIELRTLLPPQFAPFNEGQFAKLDPTVKKLSEKMKHIQEQLQGEANLLNTAQPQVSHWREIRDLLLCPNLEPETRRELFGKLFRIRLNEVAGANEAPSEVLSNDHQSAMWQMLCSIHALSLVPAPTGKAGDKLWNEWHQVSVEESRVSPERVIRLSRNLRAHWVSHLGEVNRACGSWEESRSLARNCLEQKDFSARILYASDAINLEKEPTRRFEQFLLAELLLDTSERYLDDFWNEWYANAARISSKAATRLSEKWLEKERKDLDDLINARVEAELQLKSSPVVFGLQKTAPVSIATSREKGLPLGLATTWLTFKEGDPRAVKSASLANQCVPKSVGLDVASSTKTNAESRLSVSLPNNPKSDGCASQIMPRVFFRDHTWSKHSAALFNPCPPDGTLIRHLATSNSGAIRVSGEDRKTVIFVLDASGSMLEKDANGNIVVDNWTPAKAMLLGALSDMHDKNLNTHTEPHQVELIIYGQRGTNETAKGDNHATVLTEVTMRSLTNTTISQIRTALDRSEPVNLSTTPLFAAIQKACDSLTKAGTSGTIIAITDGVPNDGIRYAPEIQSETRPWDVTDCQRVMGKFKESIQESLNQARSDRREIELQVIGIGFGGAAVPNVAAGRVELEKFVEKVNQREKKFHTADTFPQLGGKLKLTTGARHVFVGDATQPTKNLFDGPLKEPLQIPKTGKFRIAFGDPDRVKNGLPIEIQGDELLDFELHKSGELKHVHKQDLKEAMPFRISPERSGYRFGYIENFENNIGQRQAEFLIGIQNLKSDSSREAPFTQRPDRFVVEISPKNQPQTKAQPMTYRIEPGRSDPTWTIRVDEWMGGANAELNCYASWGDVPADESVSLGSDRSWPSTVKVPITSENERATFEIKVKTPENDRVDLNDSVEVQLRLSNPDDATLLAKDWRHLAYLHVQLQLDGQPIPHLDETAEVIASESEIRWRFSNLPKENFAAKRLKIAVTSWYRFRLHALNTEQSLTIKAQ